MSLFTLDKLIYSVFNLIYILNIQPRVLFCFGTQIFCQFDISLFI